VEDFADEILPTITVVLARFVPVIANQRRPKARCPGNTLS